MPRFPLEVLIELELELIEFVLKMRGHIRTDVLLSISGTGT